MLIVLVRTSLVLVPLCASSFLTPTPLSFPSPPPSPLKKKKDYISNFVAYTSTLQLLRHAPLIVRHTSCLELKSLLDANSDHALKMYQTKGWERMLLWLLTPPQADTRWLSSTAHRSRPGLSTSPGTGPGTRPGTGPGTSPGTGLSTSPGTGPGTSPGTGPGTSPCVSHDGMDYQLDNDQEISKIFNVVMETIEFILWNSMDPMEANGNLRKVGGVSNVWFK